MSDVLNSTGKAPESYQNWRTPFLRPYEFFFVLRSSWYGKASIFYSKNISCYFKNMFCVFYQKNKFICIPNEKYILWVKNILLIDIHTVATYYYIFRVSVRITFLLENYFPDGTVSNYHLVKIFPSRLWWNNDFILAMNVLWEVTFSWKRSFYRFWRQGLLNLLKSNYIIYFFSRFIY